MNMYLYACMEWTYAYVFVYVDCIFGKHTRIIGEVLVGESREVTGLQRKLLTLYHLDSVPLIM